MKRNMYASYENYNKEEKSMVVERVSYDLVDADSLAQALQTTEVVVVDAWASWCTPCKQIAPKFEVLGQRFREEMDRGRLLLLKDNIENEDSVHKNDVHVVPTFFVYIQGQITKVFTGVEFRELEAFLVSYFS